MFLCHLATLTDVYTSQLYFRCAFSDGGLQGMTKTLYFIPTTQNGDTAVIEATVEHHADILRELVRAGSDLNLQTQVRNTLT